MNISFNSRTLHKASSPTLQPESIYQALQHGMPGQEIILAKRSISGDNYQWTVPNAPGEVWQKLGEGSAVEQQAVMDTVRAYKNKAAQILRVSQEEIDAIFATPDNSKCIYFCNSGSRLRVFIVAWDFVSSSAEGSRGVVTEDSRKQKQDVIIRFVKEGQAAAGVPFVLSLPTGFSKSYTMPANGMFSLGKIMVGLCITLDINNGRKTDSFTVTKGRNIYEFDLTEPKPAPEPVPEPVKPPVAPPPAPEPEIETVEMPEPELPPVVPPPIPDSIDEPVQEPVVEPPLEDPGPESLKTVVPLLRVIEADGTPAKSFPVDIVYPDGHSEHVLTGQDGEYRLPEMTEGDIFIVKDGFSNDSTSFRVKADQTEYVLKLDYTSSVQNPDIRVKVIDEKEKPVYPGRIALNQDGRTLLVSLKEDGIFYLSNDYFRNNVPVEVKLVDNSKNEYSSSDFRLAEGEKEYTIQLDTKKCPMWKRVAEILLAASVAAGCVLAFRPVYDLLSKIVESTY